MFKPVTFVSLTLVAAASVPALAQSTAPGLWQIENKMGGNPEIERAMAQMQAQLAAMPAAQRKQMEAMMAQSGVGMGVGAGGGMTLKVCITPEMAARQQMPTQTQGDCTSKVISRSASAMQISYVCTNPPSSGQADYTFSGDKAFAMKMTSKSTVNGKPQNITMDGKGQWLSSDCGNVKPVALPSK